MGHITLLSLSVIPARHVLAWRVGAVDLTATAQRDSLSGGFLRLCSTAHGLSANTLPRCIAIAIQQTLKDETHLTPNRTQRPRTSAGGSFRLCGLPRLALEIPHNARPSSAALTSASASAFCARGTVRMDHRSKSLSACIAWR